MYFQLKLLFLNTVYAREGMFYFLNWHLPDHQLFQSVAFLGRFSAHTFIFLPSSVQAQTRLANMPEGTKLGPNVDFSHRHLFKVHSKDVSWDVRSED